MNEQLPPTIINVKNGPMKTTEKVMNERVVK